MSTKTCPTCWKSFIGDHWQCPTCKIKSEMKQEMDKQLKKEKKEMDKQLEKIKDEEEKRHREELDSAVLKIKDEARTNLKIQERIGRDSWKIEAQSKMDEAWRLISSGMSREAMKLADDALNIHPGLLEANFLQVYLLYKAGKVNDTARKLINLCDLMDLPDNDWITHYYILIASVAIEIDMNLGLQFCDLLLKKLLLLFENESYFMRNEEKWDVFSGPTFRERQADLAASPRFMWYIHIYGPKIPALVDILRRDLEKVKSLNLFKEDTISLVSKIITLVSKWKLNKERKPLTIEDINKCSELRSDSEEGAWIGCLMILGILGLCIWGVVWLWQYFWSPPPSKFGCQTMIVRLAEGKLSLTPNAGSPVALTLQKGNKLRKTGKINNDYFEVVPHGHKQRMWIHKSQVLCP